MNENGGGGLMNWCDIKESGMKWIGIIAAGLQQRVPFIHPFIRIPHWKECIALCECVL